MARIRVKVKGRWQWIDGSAQLATSMKAISDGSERSSGATADGLLGFAGDDESRAWNDPIYIWLFVQNPDRTWSKK